METEAKTVCVTGASGFIGSWLVMRLLERGYKVRATVRDPENIKKVKHLLDLPKAMTHLTLLKAGLSEEGSYDDAIKGCTGVFHLATRMPPFDSKDPENEIIEPAINGVLNIMKSCAKAKTVERLIFTSTTLTVEVQKHKRTVYDESCWSDVDFIQAVKMNAWTYFLTKTLAEKAAWEFAKQNKFDFISVLTPLVVGPFITPSMPPSLATALSLITGTEDYSWFLKDCHYIHLDDLCNAHIFLYEHPKSEGRYICSSHDSTIFELVDLLREKYPEYNVPSKFKDVKDDIQKCVLSSKKLTAMGFEFKYNLEDMFKGAIESCRAKGLIPFPNN